MYAVLRHAELHRDDAHRFYERLGFTVGSHGFRMEL